MDGKLFLGTARFLKDKGRDEAAYRSAISRAYYACFLSARHVAFRNLDTQTRLAAQLKNERSIRHDKLPTWLKNCRTAAVRKLGDDLAGLCLNRSDADYDMARIICEPDAQEAIAEADRLLKALDGISPLDLGKEIGNHLLSTHAHP